jgi:hypothetical protein
MKAAKRLEVHAHSIIRGKRANGGCYSPRGVWLTSTFSHSHEGGDRPHQHTTTGPASYTIDMDQWFKATGLRGGGRKTFTVKPSGEQFAIRALAPWQTRFELIVGDPLPGKGQPGYIGEGPGIALPLRMVLGFGMTCIVKDGTTT